LAGAHFHFSVDRHRRIRGAAANGKQPDGKNDHNQ
jgi:hypothetical protein